MNTRKISLEYLYESDRPAAYFVRALADLGKPEAKTKDKRICAILDAEPGLPKLFDIAQQVGGDDSARHDIVMGRLAALFPQLHSVVSLPAAALAHDRHRLAVTLWHADTYVRWTVGEVRDWNDEIDEFLGRPRPSFFGRHGNTKAIKASQEYADAIEDVCRVEIARALQAVSQGSGFADVDPPKPLTEPTAKPAGAQTALPRTSSALLTQIRDLLNGGQAPFEQSDQRARKAIGAIVSTIDSYFAKDEARIDHLVARHFDGLIGMDEVRMRIREAAIATLASRLHLKQTGEELTHGDHMVFLGNPGTGKTTAARRVAALLRDVAVTKGGFTEASRVDLVADHVGGSAMKIAKVIKGALGGVLFIDEAYSLSAGGERHGHDFGREAIDELVKAMEDHRHELVVIVAGYPKEMQAFLDSNPGLRSRFTHDITFPDYTPEDMVEVFKAMAAEKKVEVAPEVVERLAPIMAQVKANKGSNFGNGRDVRKLFDGLLKKAAPRSVREGSATRVELQDLDAFL